MIKVLVVDDDKLVRKGLISSMPWKDFDMEVVGEANNGEKALEFLDGNEVDLMLADLEMPVMSGIELMRAARRKYPRLYFVVLTLHQDFEYVQEALRLGAIDYIAKIQLEKERFEEVLGRIHRRILEEENKAVMTELSEKAAVPFQTDVAYVLLSSEEQPDADWIQGMEGLSGERTAEIGNGVWLYVPEDGAEYEAALPCLAEGMDGRQEWGLIKLTGIKGMNQSVVHRLLRRYRQKDYFYEHDAEKRILCKACEELDSRQKDSDREDMALLKEAWLSMKWIYQEALFKQMISELKAKRLKVSRLLHLIMVLGNEWQRVYGPFMPRTVELLETAGCWQEVEDWIRKARELTIMAVGKQPYSCEVHECIMNAVKIVHEEMEQQVFATDVAKRVNMSRSYFNQCFKDIVGRSFNDYLRHVRVEKAKEYLLQTEKSVQWIAGQIGYMDEKYFSHVFREQTGMLPSEFRQRQGKGRDLSGSR